MIRCIILTHGDLGESLVNTARKIIGPLEDIKALSNEQISIKTFAEKLESAVKEWLDSDIIIMADFCGGSCWYAAQAVKRTYPKIALIAGVNLPMVIAYWYNRTASNLNNLIKLLKDSAQKSIETIIN
jgi:mannose/fructose-specific phosphotransferase system component IIA